MESELFERWVVMHPKVQSDISEHHSIIREMLQSSEYLETVDLIARKMTESYRRGGKTVFFGNGGSASDAQHLSAELVAKLKINRPMLNSHALNVNTSVITAIANDFSYDEVFSRQIEHLVDSKDVVIGLSTSGKSKNVINALIAARNRGALTVGFTGSKGRDMEKVCDITLNVPSSNTPRIQEAHIMSGHIICEIVENELFGTKYGSTT